MKEQQERSKELVYESFRSKIKNDLGEVDSPEDIDLVIEAENEDIALELELENFSNKDDFLRQLANEIREGNVTIKEYQKEEK